MVEKRNKGEEGSSVVGEKNRGRNIRIQAEETTILATMVVTSIQSQPAPSFLTPGECENKIEKRA